MKPNSKFLNQQRRFWAYVRAISEKAGYSERSGSNKGLVKSHSIIEIAEALNMRGLESSSVYSDNQATKFGNVLVEYFKHRANLLNDYVEPRLMNLEKTKTVFYDLEKKLSPKVHIPQNKQKGKKKGPAYFTGIINMIIENNLDGLPCDYDPRALTTISQFDEPLWTLARRVDGTFPSTNNPIAIWEIKEYYHTTSFGSRVAGGVYETLLDGMEIDAVKSEHQINIFHYLMIDAHLTWWVQGKSYLCRLIDILHMGYIDELLVGYEVVERLPAIVKSWVEVHNQ